MKSIHRMIKKIFLYILVGMFLISPVEAEAFQASKDIDFAKIDKFVFEEMKNGIIPGLALGIVKGGKIVYLKGYGRADGSGRPVTPQTPFILGSTTKSFTAMAIMKLVEEGKVKLDIPVKEYLPWFTLNEDEKSSRVTVRQLLYHSGGLPRGDGASLKTKEDSIEARVRNLSRENFIFDPGQKHSYSNDGYAVLGKIIEEVSGKAYGEYIVENIFKPLDMKNSFISKEEAESKGLAQGYRHLLGFNLPTDVYYRQDWLPTGNIISTAEDLTHYLIANANHGTYEGVFAVSAQSMEEIQRNGARVSNDTTYGMGWYITPQTIEHGGATENFRSIFKIERFGEDKIAMSGDEWGVVVLENTSETLIEGFEAFGSGVYRISNGVLEILNGKSPYQAYKYTARKLYLYLDLAAGAILILLLTALYKLKSFKKHLKKNRGKLILRAAVSFLANIALPTSIFIAVPVFVNQSWGKMLLSQPDLWLVVLFGTILVFMGLAEIYLIISMLKEIEKTSINA